MKKLMCILENKRKKFYYKNKYIEFEKNCIFKYVRNAPVKSHISCVKKFREYGLNHSSQFRKFINYLMNNICSPGNYIYISKSKEYSSDKVLELYNSNQNFIYLLYNGVGQLDSLFSYIRNGFAHFNYYVEKDYIVLWNESQKCPDRFNIFLKLNLSDLDFIYDSLSKLDEII